MNFNYELEKQEHKVKMLKKEHDLEDNTLAVMKWIQDKWIMVPKELADAVLHEHGTGVVGPHTVQLMQLFCKEKK